MSESCANALVLRVVNCTHFDLCLFHVMSQISMQNDAKRCCWKNMESFLQCSHQSVDRNEILKPVRVIVCFCAIRNVQWILWIQMCWASSSLIVHYNPTSSLFIEIRLKLHFCSHVHTMPCVCLRTLRLVRVVTVLIVKWNRDTNVKIASEISLCPQKAKYQHQTCHFQFLLDNWQTLCFCFNRMRVNLNVD